MLSVFIPLATMVALVRLIYYVRKSASVINGLAFLGRMSVPIMYLHIPLNIAFGTESTIIFYIIIGVVLPCVLYIVGLLNCRVQLFLGIR